MIEYCSLYNFSDSGIFPDAVEKLIIRNNVMYNSDVTMMDPGGVQEMLIENNFVINPGKPMPGRKPLRHIPLRCPVVMMFLKRVVSRLESLTGAVLAGKRELVADLPVSVS